MVVFTRIFQSTATPPLMVASPVTTGVVMVRPETTIGAVPELRTTNSEVPNGNPS